MLIDLLDKIRVILSFLNFQVVMLIISRNKIYGIISNTVLEWKIQRKQLGMKTINLNDHLNSRMILNEIRVQKKKKIEKL